MRNRIFIVIIFIYVSGFLCSCTKESYCLEDVVAKVSVGFYTWDEGKRVDKVIDTLSIRGIGIDSILYDSALSVKSVELPLSNLSDTSRFVFTFNVEIPAVEPDTIPTNASFTDTLGIIYTSEMYLVSPICGFGYNYELSGTFATRNYIDSVKIVFPFVRIIDNENEKNIEILF